MKEESDIFLLSETAKQFFYKNKLKDDFKLDIESCPVCGGTKFKKLFKLYGFNYVLCQDCDFLFTNPRLNDAGSFLWYNSNYYNAALEAEYYINERFDRFYSVSLSGEERENAINLLINNGITKDAKILEIGCGGGSFIDILVNRFGFNNVLGIDLNKKAVEFARRFRNLNVKNINVNDFNNDERFDIVISIESIEHANDLNNYMRTIKNNLRKGGYLLISTPYNDRLARKWLGKFSDFYCAPNHVNYFNKNTLEMYLKSNKFKIIDIKLDNLYKLNIFAILRNWLDIPDQITAKPPLYPVFKRIPKFSKDHRKYIEIKNIDDIWNQRNTIISDDRKKVGIKKAIKKILTEKIDITLTHHMSVLAQFDI